MPDYELFTEDGVSLWTRRSTYGDDRGVLREVKTYDFGPGPIKTFIDLGAHIGAASLLIKHLWPDAEIVAVEPETDNFAVLERNTRELKGVMAIQGYVGGTQDMMVVLHPDHSTCHRVVPVSAVQPGETAVWAEAGMVSLESILRGRGWETVDIVKVDCEGCEIDFFATTPDEALRRARRFVGEFHNGWPFFRDGIGARLRSLGFEVTGETDPNKHATFVAARI